MINSYTILKNQIFSKNEYSIVPIRFEDRYKIMQWRNEQIYHLRQAVPLTREDQDLYFENIISKQFGEEKPSQLLFSFLRMGICIGYGGLVHINWIDRNAEVSFIMDTQLEKNYFALNWSIYLELVEQLAFDELLLHKLFVYAFDLRPQLYPILKKCGYFLDATLKEHCLFNDGFIDVVIHSKLNKI